MDLDLLRLSSSFTHLLVFLLIFVNVSFSDYEAFDPDGNITVKWDVMSWTEDGYIATVTMINYQKYRHIEAPGWQLGWTWAKKEVIWGMIGAQTTEQGDCSRFKWKIPHCCEKHPTTVDLLPGTPYNQQVANCCRGGVLTTSIQDPETSVSSFQMVVGRAGTTESTVRLPNNFTIKAPRGYNCGNAKIVEPSKFFTPDRRRFTQAHMTWHVTCTYRQFHAATYTCCVSFSSFYSQTIVNCPTCSCACRNIPNPPWTCAEPDHQKLPPILSTSHVDSETPLLHCTNHMCPIRVHWHFKLNYREYWRVKITVTNFNYGVNYTRWNLVAEHPNFDNLTLTYSFNYKPITPYPTNNSAMFWGIKYYNDVLMQAGPFGNVQSELLFRKENSKFTLSQGWAFPHKIYFNGDECVMPSPDIYPQLPNDSCHVVISINNLLTTILISLLLLMASA